MKTQTLYIAEDGTQFTDKDVCIEYEKSAPIRCIIHEVLASQGLDYEFDVDGLSQLVCTRLLKVFVIAKRIPNGQQTSPNSNDNR